MVVDNSYGTAQHKARQCLMRSMFPVYIPKKPKLGIKESLGTPPSPPIKKPTCYYNPPGEATTRRTHWWGPSLRACTRLLHVSKLLA